LTRFRNMAKTKHGKAKTPLSDLLSLVDRKALVTGAASGIGRAMALRLAEAGAQLVLMDLDEEKLDNLREQMPTAELHALDISNKSAIDRFWEGRTARDIDILVNNAGIYPFKPFLELDAAYLARVMDTNLYSVLWMCQGFIRNRIKQGGVVVNIGSVEAIMPFKKDVVHYSMSKVGVITLTRDLAREFGDKGFRVNAIIPGGILTEGTKSAAKQAIITLDARLMSDSYNFYQRLPIGRFGDPDEVARMAVVLSSNLSSYVHGALLPVDGGFLSA